MDPDGGDAAEAIMTTDTIPKEIAIELELQDTRAVIGGMAKGSGMIHPNMATMIGIITTDANISRKLLDKALRTVVKSTFNRVTVDGDTSVCDMVVIFANGMAENPGIITEGEDYEKFVKGLEYVCTYLARLIARDGEGATKLVEVVVEGAENQEDAYKAACAVAKSPLVKTMLFGNDVNWGRIITAVGYSEPNSTPHMSIYISGTCLCAKPCNDYEAIETGLRTKQALMQRTGGSTSNVIHLTSPIADIMYDIPRQIMPTKIIPGTQMASCMWSVSGYV